MTVLGNIVAVTSIIAVVSLVQGMEFSHYEEVPQHLHSKIIAASKAERGAEAAEEV